MQNQTRECAPETKAESANSQEIAGAFDDFMEAFDAFRQTNDERLAQLETRSGADLLTTQKMDRINAAIDSQKQSMDQLLLKSRRHSIDGGPGISLANHEHKKAFENYIRKGNETGLRQFEEKAMSYGSDPDGGYLVPEEMASEIGRRLNDISPIRAIATVQTVSSAIYKKPFAVTGPAVGWGRRNRCTAPNHITNVGRVAVSHHGIIRHACSNPHFA